MGDGIIDSIEEKARELWQLPGRELDKVETAAKDTITNLENAAQAYLDQFNALRNPQRGNAPGASEADPQTAGSPDTAPPSDTTSPGAKKPAEEPWWKKAWNGLFGSGKPSDDDDPKNTSFGGRFGGGILGMLIEGIVLLFSLLAGGLSGLFSAIGNFFSTDDSGETITQRLGEAVATGAEKVADTFRKDEKAIGGFAKTVETDAGKVVGAVEGGIQKGYGAVSVSAKETYAVGYLMTKGWTIEHASGIIANFKAETSLNPDLYGHGAEAKGMPGEAYGIGQWHKDRQAEFAKWAGHDIHGSSLTEQLAFTNYEMRNGKEQHAGAKIMSTQSPEQAAAACCEFYERPGDIPGQSDVRARMAREIFIAYNNQPHMDMQGAQVSSSSAPLATVPVVTGNLQLIRPAPALRG
jgi:hypothetical protein